VSLAECRRHAQRRGTVYVISEAKCSKHPDTTVIHQPPAQNGVLTMRANIRARRYGARSTIITPKREKNEQRHDVDARRHPAQINQAQKHKEL